MNDDRHDAAAPAITSAADWGSAVRWALRRASALRARQVWCFDADFADWPLDDREVIEALTRWLQLPQRRLTLLAEHWQAVPRRHARFTAWRREWIHAIDTLAVPPEQMAPWAALLVDDQGTVLRLFDREHWRGAAAHDPGLATLLRHEVDALAQRSGPDFPVTPLGL